MWRQDPGTRAYGRLPLSFEANRGQTSAQVDFVSRGSGYTLFVTPTEAVLTLRAPSTRRPTTTNPNHRARLSQLECARAAGTQTAHAAVANLCAMGGADALSLFSPLSAARATTTPDGGA